MTVNVGIIGLGWAGRTHTKHLAGVSDAAVVAGVDPDESRATSFGEEHGVAVYASVREMLDARDDLHAVMVASDASVRLEPIEAACERKLAVFCEKPPALDLATARKIRDVIEQAGVLSAVGFQSRWSPAAKRLRELLGDRPRLFARILIAWPVFDWVKDGLAPKRLYLKSGCGGPMIEQGIHYQDVLRYITGDEPVHVQALAELGTTEPREGRDCEDTTLVTVRHASGMLSTHVHNWSHTEAVLQLQVVGNAFDLTWLISEGERIVGRLDGDDVDETFEADPYVEEVRGFVAAVAAGDQSMIRSSYADACRTLAVCEAAARAVETGQGQDVERI